MDSANKPFLEATGAWCARFADALEPLAGEAVKFELLEPAGGVTWDDGLCCRQRFSLGPDALIWVAAESAVWRSLAGKVLEAAGLEDAGEQEAESTYLELLSQAAGGFANALTARTDREVVCAESSVSDMPDGQIWTPLRILSPVPAELFVACTASVGEFWKSEQSAPSDPGPLPQPDRYGAFDLLLDVELPVSVSFGRANLQIKDVLKLTTGSVVELDRAVTEPVDVVVNNRVIARGEVVVVDGNYGVRIAHIMSRDERLRSLE
jgi:flagellar motor switch protein FliN/FliY